MASSGPDGPAERRGGTLAQAVQLLALLVRLALGEAVRAGLRCIGLAIEVRRALLRLLREHGHPLVLLRGGRAARVRLSSSVVAEISVAAPGAQHPLGVGPLPGGEGAGRGDLLVQRREPLPLRVEPLEALGELGDLLLPERRQRPGATWRAAAGSSRCDSLGVRSCSSAVISAS